MKVNWKKKNSVTLFFLVTGPLFLFFEYNKQFIWGDGIAQGLFACSLYITGPAILVFIFYWPLLKKSHVSKEIEESKDNPKKIEK